jgi:glutaminyl-tRNA synthetase
MVVFDPLKVVITNYDATKSETLKSENNPEDPNSGVREMPFGNEIYIERDDFMEVPPKKYFRLSPGQMVRLKSAYIIKCEDFVKDAAGNVTEVRCSYIPESRSGEDTSGINVKGVLHWVSASQSVPMEVRLYDRLFKVEDLGSMDGDFKEYLNPDSLKVVKVLAEPSLSKAKVGEHFQFLRMGYFCLDSDSTKDKLVFNRTVALRDMWAKEAKKG